MRNLQLTKYQHIAGGTAFETEAVNICLEREPDRSPIFPQLQLSDHCKLARNVLTWKMTIEKMVETAQLVIDRFATEELNNAKKNYAVEKR